MSSWPHLIIVPIVLPLMTGAFLLLLGRWAPKLVPWVAGVSTLLGLFVSVALLAQANTGQVQAYLLSNWAAPFGIALALDRLAAMMLLLTSLLACATFVYSLGGDAARGRHFHSLFQFQLMGLCGAFLTADLFNLFVFFEVLLIASYGLLLHGAGAQRLKASIHFVTINLTGSALFLVAVSLLYGMTGTLNMADLAVLIPLAPPDRHLLLQTAALLLLVVFGVKAALMPMFFGLPATYGAASAPVAALFAIMTKVGIYAILRVATLIFGDHGGPTFHVAAPMLEVLALVTLVLGAAGALAARELRSLVGNVVVASAGTLLLSISLARVDTIAAGLYYLVNSTLAAAALFLLADRVRAARLFNQVASASADKAGDTLAPLTLGSARLTLGLAFFALAVAAAGLPPLAGFLGKAMLLQAAGQTPHAAWIVFFVLASSLLVMVAFARSGSSLFWKSALDSPSHQPASATSVSTPAGDAPYPSHAVHRASLFMLALLILACAVFAGPLSRYTSATANQLMERQSYISAVLYTPPVPAAIDVRREMRERKAQENAGGKP